jgi:hypothetical protein
MTSDWKQLSEAASREPDPEKLLELVEQLDKALEQRENDLKEKRSSVVHDPANDHKSNLYPMIAATEIRSLSA